MKKKQLFQEGVDYYFDEQGMMVLTSKFLRKRGYCCQNLCKHCPLKDTKKKG